MRTQLLWAAGALVLLVAVNGVCAQGQADGNAIRREIPTPIRTPRRGAGRQVDANQMAQREQMREQISRRRRQADQNEPADINAPRARIRPEQAGKGAGEQHKQQLQTVEQQLAQETAKHRERVAKLTRIRELAQQQGDTETAGKADKLLEQNRQRYEAKTQRLERRKKTIIQFMEKADANKP